MTTNLSQPGTSLRGATGPVHLALSSGILALIAAVPRHSHAQAAAASEPPQLTLRVNCAATARGNGSAAHPYWRITDALEKARGLRRTMTGRITISVAPGTCSGNFETQPTGQTTRPPELLPLVVNVPNLTLRGAGIMAYAQGFPIAHRAGTATTLTVDIMPQQVFPNSVIYVGPTTDGGRADGAVVEGLAIDNQLNAWYGIHINRTQNFTIRNNVVADTWLGAIDGSECSGRIVGNVVHGGSPGIEVSAGTTDNPSMVYIGGNTATGNIEGMGSFGDSAYTNLLDMGANPLVPLPRAIDPVNNDPGNHVEVEIAGNDVSDNFVYGLRLSPMGGGKHPYLQTGYIVANIHDNRFIDNAGYPFVVDQGFSFRSSSSYWTNPNPDPVDFPEGFLAYFARPFITHGPFGGPYSGEVKVILADNAWRNPHVTPIAPAMLTFTNVDNYDPATGEPAMAWIDHYTYMRNSMILIEDDDGLIARPGVIRDDLRLYDPVDGTALLNQTRISR